MWYMYGSCASLNLLIGSEKMEYFTSKWNSLLQINHVDPCRVPKKSVVILLCVCSIIYIQEIGVVILLHCIKNTMNNHYYMVHTCFNNKKNTHTLNIYTWYIYPTRTPKEIGTFPTHPTIPRGKTYNFTGKNPRENHRKKNT